MKQKGTQQITPLHEALTACRVMLKYVLLFGFLCNIFMLATPLYSMQVFDRVLSSGNVNTLVMLTIVIVVALTVLAFVQAVRALAMNRMGTWLEHKLSETIFANSVKTALDTRTGSGSQQLRDLQTIKTFMLSPGLITIMDTPWAIIFIIVLFILHTYLGLLAVLGGVVLISFAIVSDRITKPLHDANNENFIKSMRQVDQSTRNAEVIEVMGFLPDILRTWQKLNQKVQNTQALASKRQAVLTELTKFIRMVLQLFVTGLGAYLVLKGELSMGAIIASSSLVGRALAPFEAAISSWKGFVNARKAYNRLNQMFARRAQTDRSVSLPEPEGRLNVENVYFAPAGAQKHILKGINFQLEAGETLVILGSSGSGKTTLAKLIVGAWTPTVGTVRVDGASYQDWRREDIGPYIGYLPQDVELFGGTIKDNIARMQEGANSEDVIRSAQLAGVHDMILQLPQAYDTNIGIDGSTLSGGQRQRIGLARSFFGNPKLLVLDEPNASLDTQGEAALATAVAVAKEQKITTVIISHRTSVLNLADKILLIQDGAVAKFGDKQQILNEMNKMQPIDSYNKNRIMKPKA